MTIVPHHESEDVARPVMDQFDRLSAESTERAKIIPVAVHPHMSGVSRRIRTFEEIVERIAAHDGVALRTGERMLQWVEGTETCATRAEGGGGAVCEVFMAASRMIPGTRRAGPPSGSPSPRATAPVPRRTRRRATSAPR